MKCVLKAQDNKFIGDDEEFTLNPYEARLFIGRTFEEVEQKALVCVPNYNVKGYSLVNYKKAADKYDGEKQ